MSPSLKFVLDYDDNPIVIRQLTKKFETFFLIAISSALTGCPSDSGGGSGSLSLENAPSLDDPSEISISFSTINEGTIETHKSREKVDSDSRIYFNTNQVVVKGTCVFGVAKVVAFVDSQQVEEVATCDSELKFEWKKTFPGNTPETGTAYNVDLKPSNSSGKAFGNLTPDKYISLKIQIDDNPPSPTTGGVVNNSVNTGLFFSVSGSGPTATITGTTTAPTDAYKVVVDNHKNVAVTLSGTSVTFTDSLQENVQKTYRFIVYDRAGNASPSEEIKAIYASQIPVIAYSFNSFGGTTSNVNGSLPFHIFTTHGPWKSVASTTNLNFLTDLFGTLAKSPK